jgi:hypothetical protein
VKEEVRFALVKRVAQLTGVRVLDADVSAVKTVAELRMLLVSLSFCAGGGFVEWGVGLM